MGEGIIEGREKKRKRKESTGDGRDKTRGKWKQIKWRIWREQSHTWRRKKKVEATKKKEENK